MAKFVVFLNKYFANLFKKFTQLFGPLKEKKPKNRITHFCIQ